MWGPSNTVRTPSGMIVESLALTPKNGEAIGEIENDDGASVTLIYLQDGFRARIRGVYDSNLVYPVETANVTLRLPVMQANAVPVLKDYTCTLEAITPDWARKRETMIEMGVVYRPGIHGDPANVA